MKKVDYRCNRCMIVESRWLSNTARSFEYITCSGCGGESVRIGIEPIHHNPYLKELPTNNPFINKFIKR
jgi:hypothetical protein